MRPPNPSPPPHRQGPVVPRAARQTDGRLLLVAAVVLFWFSPLTLVTWVVGQLVILRQRRWHWHRFTLAALAAIGLVVLVAGPKDAVVRHFFVPAHFWEYVALGLGFGPAGVKITVAAFAYDLLVTQVWLAVPVGLLAASLAVWAAERGAGGAEWHPIVQRRVAVAQRAKDRKLARILADPRDQALDVPALGVAIDGDLPAWVVKTRRARFVVPPANLRGKAMAVVGVPGAGKTVTLSRLVYLAAQAGRKVCFIDCKGTDPKLVPQLIAAYQLGNPGARIGQWPDTRMDMWRGSPTEVQSRLLSVMSFSDTFWQGVASAGLRLALTAPGVPPVRSSDELLRRLHADELGELWAGHPLQLGDLEEIGKHLGGARLRYADFFAALAGAFDRGIWSYEDVDLAVLTVPTLLDKNVADATTRIVLEDYGHYAVGRKPRTGEDALLLVDEFSAVTNGVDSAINLGERVRDVGVQLITSSQSVEGLGTERQAARLLASCAGGVIVHQCPDPERLLAMAGMVRQVEQQWNLDEWGPSGTGRLRMADKPRVDPEQVRAAVPGEGWVIQAGRAVHLRVLPPPRPPAEPEQPAAAQPIGADGDTVPLRPIPAGPLTAADALAARVTWRIGHRLIRRWPERRGGRLPSPRWRLPARPAGPGRGWGRGR
jgi:hypothetical protein